MQEFFKKASDKLSSAAKTSQENLQKLKQSPQLNQFLKKASTEKEKLAEKLKKEMGSVILEEGEKDERITLPRDISFDGRSFYKEAMTQILQARMAETLQIVRDDLEEQNLWGAVETEVVLTGGGARLRGLGRLASEIFPRPVRIGRARDFLGEQSDLERPEFSTVLGTLKYAAETERKEANQTVGWRKIQKSLGRMVSSLKFLA
jgi:cell division protein FtsA